MDGTFDILIEYIHNEDKKAKIEDNTPSEEEHFDIVVFNMENTLV
ncbi:MAG: hypothetical protein BAJALOKI2v1_190033 [Promethearchaeota archaeon]|nr:MAG: hypothetical protein BAJALOKI2v1_190033 [Candidatus Lokiarchaeota archaeon]